MGLLEELRICINVLNSMKASYLEKLLEEKFNVGEAANLIIGQYVAYASCESILLDLVKKYEEKCLS